VQGCASIENLQKKQWIKVQSNNFTYYTTLDSSRAEKVVDNLEAFHSLIALSNPLKQANAKVPTIIYGLSSEYAKKFNVDRGIGGFFQQELARNIVFLKESNKDIENISTIMHEYVHYAHATRQVSYPRWLEEGTAEYLSGTQEKDGLFTLGYVQKGRLNTLYSERWLKGEELINPVNYNDWSSVKQSTFYAQAWFLTFYLNNKEYPPGKTYSQSVVAYLKALRNGDDNLVAFEKAFNLSPSSISKTLTRYFKRGKYKKMAFDKSELLKSVEINISTLSVSQVSLILADFALSQSQYSLANSLYDQAMLNNASKASALIGRAKVSLSEENMNEAIDYLDKLDVFKPAQFESLLVRAQLLLSLAKNTNEIEDKEKYLNEARGYFTQAWKIKPDSPILYFFYAQTYFEMQDNNFRAIEMLKEANGLNPSYLQIKVDLLKAEALTDLAAGKEYGQQLLANLNSEYDQSYKDQVANILSHIENYTTYLKSNNFKAWAESPSGAYGFIYQSESDELASQGAIDKCIQFANKEETCLIIDQNLVEPEILKQSFIKRLLAE